ncbi:MAG: putative TNF receptor-associated factor 4-like [Hyperionvirus sp.]|uniref:Putative TNF receptor-associated factor 4-like n=1 Tax=Hyperionvirus sp. TaxID=2487770 RepID=A0A3G5AD14_9VIRU|nr:MAG: putative TNF receptor-associated factor 4-like [Hyperionvirus sp.]
MEPNFAYASNPVTLTSFEKDDVSNGDNIDYCCLICHAIPRRPANLKCCGKIYCLECLQKLMTTSTKCPICRTSIKTTDVVSNPYILEKVNGLSIKCTNNECKKIVTIGLDGRNIISHLLLCDYTKGKCSGCQLLFSNKKYKEHLIENRCPDVMITCKICTKSYSHNNKDSHKNSEEHLHNLEKKYEALQRENGELQEEYEGVERENKNLVEQNKTLSVDSKRIKESEIKYQKDYVRYKDKYEGLRIKYNELVTKCKQKWEEKDNHIITLMTRIKCLKRYIKI